MKEITLVNDTIDKRDIDELIEWLQTYPRLTKGELTIELEKKWATYIGTKYSVFVNSGSSANLLVLYALSQLRGYEPTQKIIVPALSWATDVAPIMQLGFDPILVDCNMNDLTIDIDHLTHILKTHSDIVAIISVSVLGFSPDIIALTKLSAEYNLDLIEDNCESMGSTYNGIKLGNFGIASTYSTYFGHHISTIEGGFVNTDDEELYHMLLMLRSHGWDRDLPYKERINKRDNWNVSEFDSLLTFYVPGFNLRSTDLNAKIGLKQIDKLDKHVEIRNRNFNLYQNLLWTDKEKLNWKPKPRDLSYVSNFAYPIIHRLRKSMVRQLRESGVEVRPLICGSMGTQPFYVDVYGEEKLKNADIIKDMGFYVPNHPGMLEDDVKYICDILNTICIG